MADKKISELNAAVIVNDSDELVLNQGGETKKVTKAVLEASIDIGAVGEPNTSSNVGTGEGQLAKAKVGFDLPFKSVKAGVDIGITNNANEIIIDYTGTAGATLFTGLGDTPSSFSGYAGKVVKVNITETALEFADDDAGEANTASNVGVGEGQLVKPKVGSDLPFKTIRAGTSVSITNDADEVVINALTGAFNFLQLTDTPSSYMGQSGKFLKVNVAEDGLEYTTVESSTTFTGLTDTPNDFNGHALKFLQVDAGETSIQFASVAPGVTDFLGLTDTPSTYTLQAGKILKVNMLENGLEFVDETSGVTDFLSLTDTPMDYTGQSGKILKVNMTEDALEFVDETSGVTDFISLTDTPMDYTGQSGKILKVNMTEDALEFVDETSGVTDFLSLTDTPMDYSTNAGRVLKVNMAEDALEFSDDLGEANTLASVGSGQSLVAGKLGLDLQIKSLIAGANIGLVTSGTDITISATSGAGDFLSLSDTPADYSGQAGKHLAVTGAADGIEFVAAPTPGVTDFLGLSDTPMDYTGQSGKILKVNMTEDALEFVDEASGVTDFLSLTDTPMDYTGQSGKFLQVNMTEDALEFTDVSGEANALVSVGTGESLDAGKIGSNLQIKSLIAGTNVGISSSGTDLTINANFPPQAPPSFSIPTALLDGIGDAGKLLKSFGGQAILPDIQAAQASSPDTWELTINSVGTVAVSGAKEKISVQFPPAMFIPNGSYWYFYWNDGAMETEYYVWYNVGGLGIDPMPSPNGIQVGVGPADDPTMVMFATRNAISMILAPLFTDNGIDVLFIEHVYEVAVTDSVDFNTGFAINVITQGSSAGLIPAVPEVFSIEFADVSMASYNNNYFTWYWHDGMFPVEYNVWYSVDGGGTPPMLNPMTLIQVDVSSSDLASDVALATEIAITTFSPQFATSVTNLGTGIEIANANGGAVPDATENLGLPPMSITVLQQGADAIPSQPSSAIYWSDDAVGFNTPIQAGVDWTPDPGLDPVTEAFNINVALNNSFMMFDPTGKWSSTIGVPANKLVISRDWFSPIDDQSLRDINFSVGNWDGADPSKTQTSTMQAPIPAQALGPYIGKMIGVSAGNATVDSSRVIELVNDGAVSDNETVVVSENFPGRIRASSNGNPGDVIVGIAIKGGADAATSLVLLYPNG